MHGPCTHAHLHVHVYILCACMLTLACHVSVCVAVIVALLFVIIVQSSIYICNVHTCVRGSLTYLVLPQQMLMLFTTYYSMCVVAVHVSVCMCVCARVCVPV